MLKIWGRNNSINVQKVLWCCQELGLAFERIDAGGKFGVVNDPDYKRLNPNSLVPTVEDEDEGVVLWESNAIVRYLGWRYGAGVLCPESAGARAVADQWMDWQQTTVWPSLRPIFWALVRLPPEERDDEEVEAARRKNAEAWAILDDHLKDRAFVAGDELTMGDIPLGACVFRWFNLDIERPPMSRLEAWYERLSARKAYRDTVMLPLS